MRKQSIDLRDERVLLLLGLLMSQSQHGYQLYEFIERNLSQLSTMPKATAYALLERMAKADLVVATMEQAGNRPVRRTYSITDQGRDVFATMLFGVLSEPVIAGPPGDISLMFVDYLDRQAAREAMQARLDRLDVVLAALAAAPLHEVGAGVDLSIKRRLALLKADRAWFAETMSRLSELLPEQAAFPEVEGGAGHP